MGFGGVSVVFYFLLLVLGIFLLLIIIIFKAGGDLPSDHPQYKHYKNINSLVQGLYSPVYLESAPHYALLPCESSCSFKC